MTNNNKIMKKTLKMRLIQLFVLGILISLTSNNSLVNASASHPLLNGNFESGVLSPWTTNPTYPSGVTSNSWHVYEGTYGLALYRYISSTFYKSYVEQSINYDVDKVNSIVFYMRAYVDVKVTVSYSDGTTTPVTFTANGAWGIQSISQSQLSAGKIITKIRFETLSNSVNGTAIDGIAVNTLYLKNGDFESGVLSPWTTNPTYPSGVTSNSWHVYEGTYGLALYRYISSTFYKSYVEQSINYMVDEVNSISFYMRAYVDVKVTVTYSDGSTTPITFTANGAWGAQSISQSQLSAGKIITKIRFETLSNSVNGTAIDGININTLFLMNGNFELGSLSHWNTNPTYPSSITSNAWHVYEGTYGLALYRYIGTTFYKSYIEQSINCDVDMMSSIDFFLKNYVEVKVTITYIDGSTTQINYSANYGWQGKSISSAQLSAGNTIVKIKFETTINSPNGTAIDGISIN
ncbi:MAG: hypothetical protein OEZ01_08150 [Candidatus Heimdallarchaeota archaeon]|nr:hypothetical protein [Candidatus Heimdallarchaeota archaeon]MDH5645964.1 hypothetical protein [Candidatus Heimdallarchaeota archaeon]